ncbi:fibroblast growth factor [Anticarsia gemmatalis multiple nucleopolyhedrovirus]|uniref:Fibroblast growth factor n=1 Tax=Anticarsia gemmatalis multiple nucleopolyhedrovirus TaxID=268591 RepID=A0A0S3IYF4_9ABAC|nr:fibroblast growth factor [Anticarsia gemmatalis multiple nucleopolyhedrovirus]YP_803423.1 fibroblast growth factor [Anticarsia gemmatalis nucleopolyhedrovirus]ABI13813.1 fibroblast growth factor [Anticarsia gemmatalis multiple nucleopolyhedrovirus]ALR69939.1 fibroblast growth factor [Anticarsia gemmatalis multiple nucleopolyhedrovirus]ALR70097.1 fibroblast growth factor [Anticarsia gemmatalis multiple nucleopolyhedrovirus]ALR70254.1 fibroblast growth factor [Anticarsia gemmatalis multiple n
MHRFALVVAAVASLCACQQLEHITGSQRLVHMFVHNHYLAVHTDGVVNGTLDPYSLDTVLQRVSRFKHPARRTILLRNAISCMHVCLDRCGVMYASAALSSDCFLQETIVENNYDVMFKIYNRKLTYVALDNFGRARRLQLSRRRTLGKLSMYALILRSPLNYTSVSQCPKQTKIVKHRKCNLS